MNETKIICENCGKGELTIAETPAGNVIKRGFTGRRGPQYYQGSLRYITPKCPVCGAFHGKAKVDREKTIERLKSRGLPLTIRSGN